MHHHHVMRISAILFLLLIPHVISHNWMTQPTPYSPKLFKCEDGKTCSHACPISSSPGSPVATYRRGEVIRVTWNRNNHHGGFYRLTLVPQKFHYNRTAHTRFTLKHGCWETGEHDCAPSEDCGTDSRREAYSTNVKIPSVYPDGTYIMGYVWYGGVRFQRDLGQFSDYFSCAVVRVQGGAPLGGSYRAYFEAGEGSKIENGQCRTSSDAIGDCEHGCPQKRTFAAIPRVFRDGGLPPISAADVVNSATGDMDNGGGAQGTGAAGLDRSGNGRTDSEEEDQDSSVGNSGNSPGSGVGTVDRGICSGRVCCASQCGRCGGQNCHRLPGGGHQCCSSTISRSGRACSDTVGAPCIRG